jgi:serralysin
MTGNAATNFFWGNAGNDKLYGGNGNDNLVGGTGADRLDGGSGVDLANYGRAAAGVMADLLSPGVNTGEAAGDTYSSVERLYGSGFADNLRGDNLANAVYGAGGNDILYGRGGNDSLVGGDGNDNLVGGAGADRLIGGSGADVFIFETAAHSSSSLRDSIEDFTSGLDHIDLRTVDANTDLTGNQAFSFIGNKASTGNAGELNFENGVVSGYINGDTIADFQINVASVSVLVESDFFL